MKNYSEESKEVKSKVSTARTYSLSIVNALNEPFLVVNADLRIVCANSELYKLFGLIKAEVENQVIFDINGWKFDNIAIEQVLKNVLVEKTKLKDIRLETKSGSTGKSLFLMAAGFLKTPEDMQDLILISFKPAAGPIDYEKNQFNFKNILAHAPAMICTLRGPSHVFELANERYYQLVGSRDIIGKTVKEVLPEVEAQGFLQLLNEVYRSGEPYMGQEVPIKLNIDGTHFKNSFIDFVYQPTFNIQGKVDGIFVHALDVTEKVLVRKKIEENEQYLRNLIDTVPVMVWISDPAGRSTYLNKNWYSYTGQTPKGAENFGWLKAVHPEDAIQAEESFREANKERRTYKTSFRLRNKNGEYRWVIDKGSPKYDNLGEYEGMVGTVVDIHEEKIKENIIIEKEHRLRSIVEEAPVATAVYTGMDMKIEFANDVMIRLWGKDRSVIGKKLQEALPELDGQPFQQLLEEVYSTGNTYRGNEQAVNLLIDNKMTLGFFNFTYKPLRNEKGEIYGILNMAQDVTEMVKSKALLEESELHFRQMADLMPTKVSNSDAEGNFLYFNQGWLEYTGLSLEELKLKGWSQFIHPDQKHEFERYWERSIQTGDNFEMEVKCRNKSGDYEWHLSRAEAVKDNKGKTKIWICATTNIQEQKEVMENLEYSTALLETHNQTNRDGILLVDTKGKMISFNQRFVDIWNMPQHIVDAKNDDAAIEFAEKQLSSPSGFKETVKSMYDSPNQSNIEELRLKNGKIIERHGYPVVGVDGTFYAWSWTFRDITLQKNQEKSIKESELYYRQMTDLMPGKIINTDPQGNPMYFNQHWLGYTGLSKEEMKTKGWIQFIHPKQKKEFLKCWKKSLATGENFEMEIKLLNKNGKYKWHLSRAEAVIDEEGKIKMWICTNTQIQKLKEEEKRKGDFLKMVSHELKTPVTSIKGYVQLLLSFLKDGGDATNLSSLPLKPSLERIDHQIRRLTRLISEMLDLSRIEENKLELQKERFNLNDLVNDTVQDINYTNTQHKINVFHEFEGEVYADKDRIGQVLINFITNAIKYSPDDQYIEVRILKVNDNQVAVCVKDYGMGIEKKYHKNIFKRFYRIGVKSEETYSGFGIGLYLANEIIQRHDGVITVKSKKGKGSEFKFTLNLDPGK